MVVPFWLATTEVFLSFPDISKSSFFPLGASSWRAVVMWKCESAHNDESASPRKPKVVRDVRSPYVASFDV